MGPGETDSVEQIPPAAASTYTKLAAAYGTEYYNSVAETLAPRLDPADRLLDAGTGPGLLALALAERTDAEIHAFDLTRELVGHGYTEAKRREVDDQMSFFVADCYAIPTPDQSYGHLLSTGVLHSLDEPAAALAEFYRVLEPGGTAFVFDPTVLFLPDEPDIELTDREQAVFEAYGVQTIGEQRRVSTDRARRLVEASPFGEADVSEGHRGDLRLYLTRRD